MARTKRIGALVPATNPVVEPDFYRVIPKEITVHFERMWNGQWGNQPEQADDDGHRLKMNSEEANEVDWALFGFDVNKMNDDVARGSRSLANIEPDLLVYACTSGTWHKGYLAYDRRMSEIMEDASGVDSITAVTSCIAAMRHMGSRKVSIAGPYRNFHLREPPHSVAGGSRVQRGERRRRALDARVDEPVGDRGRRPPGYHRLRSHRGKGRGRHGLLARHRLEGAGTPPKPWSRSWARLSSRSTRPQSGWPCAAWDGPSPFPGMANCCGAWSNPPRPATGRPAYGG